MGLLIGTTIFFWTQPHFVGAIWLIAAAVCRPVIPLLLRSGRRAPLPA